MCGASVSLAATQLRLRASRSLASTSRVLPHCNINTNFSQNESERDKDRIVGGVVATKQALRDRGRTRLAGDKDDSCDSEIEGVQIKGDGADVGAKRGRVE